MDQECIRLSENTQSQKVKSVFPPMQFLVNTRRWKEMHVGVYYSTENQEEERVICKEKEHRVFFSIMDVYTQLSSF